MFVLLGLLAAHVMITYIAPSLLQVAKGNACFSIVPEAYCTKNSAHTVLTTFGVISIALTFYFIFSRIWISTFGRKFEKRLFDLLV